MIPSVRPLSSIPLQHRQQTLRAIAGKAHDLTARIERLRHDGDRFRDALQQTPPGSSRLQQLNSLLNGN